MTDNKDDDNEIKIEFLPGCFDNFEGTQEELDELIAEIEQMAKDGTLIEKAEPYRLDPEDMSPEELKALNDLVESLEHLEDAEVDAMSDEEIFNMFVERLQGKPASRKLN